MRGGQSYPAFGVMETPDKIWKNVSSRHFSVLLRFGMAKKGSFGDITQFSMGSQYGKSEPAQMVWLAMVVFGWGEHCR